MPVTCSQCDKVAHIPTSPEEASNQWRCLSADGFTVAHMEQHNSAMASQQVSLTPVTQHSPTTSVRLINGIRICYVKGKRAV